jgi:hypothetical protein
LLTRRKRLDKKNAQSAISVSVLFPNLLRVKSGPPEWATRHNWFIGLFEM